MQQSLLISQSKLTCAKLIMFYSISYMPSDLNSVLSIFPPSDTWYLKGLCIISKCSIADKIYGTEYFEWGKDCGISHFHMIPDEADVLQDSPVYVTGIQVWILQSASIFGSFVSGTYILQDGILNELCKNQLSSGICDSPLYLDQSLAKLITM